MKRFGWDPAQLCLFANIQMHAGRSGCHFNVKLACRPTGKLFTRSFPPSTEAAAATTHDQTGTHHVRLLLIDLTFTRLHFL
ncbi:hypothetical protein QQ045_007013 [Rhodiola kirilowii]